MRETTNLKLTQFDGSDVPNWLDQYNSDNLKIDTAIGEQAVKNTEFSNTTGNLQTQITNNRNQIDENTQDIANTKKDIINIKGGSDSSIATLEKNLTTTDQTVSTLKTTVGTSDFSNVSSSITEAIGNTPIKGGNTISNDLQKLHDGVDSIVDQNSRIEKLEQSVGSSPISNIDTTITGAIGNEALKIGESLSESVNSIYDIIQTIGTNFVINKTYTIPSATTITTDLVEIPTNLSGHYFCIGHAVFGTPASGDVEVILYRVRNSNRTQISTMKIPACKTGSTIAPITTTAFDLKENDHIHATTIQDSGSNKEVSVVLTFFRLIE